MMINATKIVFGTQKYTPTWRETIEGTSLKCIPDNKDLVITTNIVRPLNHMYDIDKAAEIGRRDLECDECKRRRNKKKSVPP